MYTVYVDSHSSLPVRTVWQFINTKVNTTETKTFDQIVDREPTINFFNVKTKGGIMPDACTTVACKSA